MSDMSESDFIGRAPQGESVGRPARMATAKREPRTQGLKFSGDRGLSNPGRSTGTARTFFQSRQWTDSDMRKISIYTIRP